MKIYISLLFLFVRQFLNCQTIINGGVTNRHFGQGLIDDKFEITFELDEIIRPNYFDNCFIGQIRQYIGRYYYEPQGEYINIAGVIKLKNIHTLENDTIILFEFDANFNKIATIMGKLTLNSFTGVRVQKNNGQSFNFAITFEKNNFTELSITSSKGVFSLPVNHENKYNQNIFEQIKVIESNDKNYVVCKLSLTHCYQLNCRGTSCGDYNVYIRLYSLSNNNNSFKEYFLSGYDLNYGGSRELVEEKINMNIYNAKVIQYDNGVESHYAITIDFNNLEDGIKELKL